MNNAEQSPLSIRTAEDYLRLLDRYQALLESIGKKVYRSSREQGLKLVSALTETQLQALVRRINGEITALEQVLAAGESPDDGSRQLWRFLKSHNLTPCADLFDKISDGDMIQVFSQDQMLIFANANIFDFVSFTMEQLFTLAWYEATIRDPEIEQMLATTAIHALSGQARETYCPNVPLHMVQEVDSAKCLRSTMNVKWVSPLFAEQKVIAFAGILNGELIPSAAK
jgi:hypothetical protein